MLADETIEMLLKRRVNALESMPHSEIDILASLVFSSFLGPRATGLACPYPLSRAQLDKYTTYLLDTRFIEETVVSKQGTHFVGYQATAKGIAFLKDYHQINNRFQT